MKVKEVMTTDVIYVDKDVDVKYVMKLMKKYDITKVPVLEDKKPMGLITDSTLAVKLGAIRTRGVPASRLHASSVMDKEIELVSSEAHISKVLDRVGKPGPTMIFATDEDKNLIGVLTKADFLPLVSSNQQLSEIIKPDIYTISPDDRVIHARRQMIDAGVARLPVLNNGLLIGVISDIDIAFALEKIKKSFPLGRQKHQLEELLVNDAMSIPAISIDAEKTVSDAAKLMIEHGVGFLPVLDVNSKKVIGVVSRTDLLKSIKFLKL